MQLSAIFQLYHSDKF